MGDTWIVDLRHYLTPAGAMADMPPRARLLAGYFASIVVDATTNIDEMPTVRCRRHPKHRRCTGIVMSYPNNDENDGIHWYCPLCHDNGIITVWQNTLWDGFASRPPCPDSDRLNVYNLCEIDRLPLKRHEGPAI